jgi:hypothetical protein
VGTRDSILDQTLTPLNSVANPRPLAQSTAKKLSDMGAPQFNLKSHPIAEPFLTATVRKNTKKKTQRTML